MQLSGLSLRFKAQKKAEEVSEVLKQRLRGSVLYCDLHKTEFYPCISFLHAAILPLC
jgi:hypothetical protein